ncbi:Transcription initiation factor IIA subunit 2 [Nymphaea thermarum]|nr:Transcription initiation factor IIA subunit 2 [Nymphaea thermarum]
MATFELYRRSTIGMCLTETLDEMVSNGTLTPELAIQVLVQFDKSMTEALETQVKSKVTIKPRSLKYVHRAALKIRLGNRGSGRGGMVAGYRFKMAGWDEDPGIGSVYTEMAENSYRFKMAGWDEDPGIGSVYTEMAENNYRFKMADGMRIQELEGHLHTYRFCDNVWTFILQDATFKNEDSQENVGRVKIVACDSKLLTQ